MKRMTTLSLLVLFALTLSSTAQAEIAYDTSLVIADFDTGDKPNNLGEDFGAWDKDSNDETQTCEMSFEEDDALGDPIGYSLRLDYDVDSPNPAYNGIWMKLGDVDGSAYNALTFYIRGDEVAGYTRRVKVEIKDSTNRPAQYIIGGLTAEWQKVSIPFEKFKIIKYWNALTEFVIVFDDINSNPKSGTIFVDHIALSKE